MIYSLKMKRILILLAFVILSWCSIKNKEIKKVVNNTKYIHCVSKDLSIYRYTSLLIFSEYTIIWKQFFMDELYYDVLDKDWKKFLCVERTWDYKIEDIKSWIYIPEDYVVLYKNNKASYQEWVLEKKQRLQEMEDNWLCRSEALCSPKRPYCRERNKLPPCWEYENKDIDWNFIY